MSSPFDAEREGTIFDEGLAEKTLDAFSARETTQAETYILGPGSVLQQPDPHPWL